MQLEEELRRQRQHFEEVISAKDAELQKYYLGFRV